MEGVSGNKELVQIAAVEVCVLLGRQKFTFARRAIWALS